MGYLVNLSGAADSNLYYPEIPFWKHISVPKQAAKYIKDCGRMLGYSRADYWVFETDTLAQRAIDYAGYPENRVEVVKMSASTFVTPSQVDDTTRCHFKKKIGNGFSLLFMAGANPNKRIDCVALAIAEIRAKKLTGTRVRVVTTLNSKSSYFQTLQREFSRLGVSDAWINLGPIPIAEIPSLIDACDAVCLFSVLESFSSNFTEAWAMSKPLLVSDADWARSACGKAAMYVTPNNASLVADAIVTLMQPTVQANLLKHYGEHFSTYPTANERCKQYLECMARARQMGSIANETRRTIRSFVSKECPQTRSSE